MRRLNPPRRASGSISRETYVPYWTAFLSAVRTDSGTRSVAARRSATLALVVAREQFARQRARGRNEPVVQERRDRLDPGGAGASTSRSSCSGSVRTVSVRAPRTVSCDDAVVAGGLTTLL